MKGLSRLTVPVALAPTAVSVPQGSLVRRVAPTVLSVPRLGVNSNDKSKHLRHSSLRSMTRPLGERKVSNMQTQMAMARPLWERKVP